MSRRLATKRRSLKGCIWETPSHSADAGSSDEAACQHLAAECRVSPLTARVLISRGVRTAEEAAKFLQPGLHDLHDPFLMADMEKAASILSKVVAQKDPVFVFGDYDVDGLSAAALMLRSLHRLGAPVGHYVPHRLNEGYGLNRQAVERAASEGYRVLVAVDAGTSSVEEVKLARALGLQIIVADHHQPGKELAPADALLNPRRPDCAYPFKELSAVGVAFKLLCGLGEAIGLPAESPHRMLDLVALGTIADVVPLLGENRALAAIGLRVLSRSKKVGLNALAQAAGLRGSITSYHAAFVLAPRLNAAGRLAHGEQALRLLLSRDDQEARALADSLNELNTQRQQEEARILQEAEQMLQGIPDLRERRAIVLASQGWHPGVIGIVASRLLERYHRPTFLIAVAGGVGRGSARSVPGLSAVEALGSCCEAIEAAGMSWRYGGHHLAAGFTIPEPAIPVLSETIERRALQQLSSEDLRPRLRLDALAEPSELSPRFVTELNRLAPFGCGNPGPILGLSDAVIEAAAAMGAGARHLRLTLKTPAHGAGAPDARAAVWNAAWFDAPAPALSSVSSLIGKPVDVAFRPEIDEWNSGRTVRLLVEDIAI
jgi:single-stranded-DNA-specific exonuclease